MSTLPVRVEEEGLVPASLCLTPDRMVPGHRLRPLFGGSEAYPLMLEAIATAREEICLETYIWAGDANGRRFVDALCIKAHEGVRVRCIIDGAGSFGFPSSLLGRMREAGVQLSVFHPVGPWRRHWGWQVRDHRKVLLVDGRLAFTGGMNLGDDYAPRAWGGRDWNDVHVAVEGPAVREMLLLFELTWLYAAPETWDGPDARTLPAPPPAIELPGASTRAQVLAVGRWFGRRAIQHHLRHAISRARRRVYIEAAYFVPNRVIRSALRRAARRGVDVRVMLPRDSDVPGIGHASRATWGTLLKAGVRIFEWRPSMLHAKTIVVDGEWSAVGSYNLDQRSFAYNWELTLAVLDPELAALLERRFHEDLAWCDEVLVWQFRRRSWLRKLQEDFFYLFRIWL